MNPQTSTYYPKFPRVFGSGMPVFGFFEGVNYPFGFNNKMKENELYGEGCGYDFGARMYDARIGRWWSVDPESGKYVSHSPYCFVGDMAILMVEIDGRVWKLYGSRHQINKFKSALSNEFGGNVTVSINSQGIVSLTIKKGKTLEGYQKRLYDKLNTVISDENTTVNMELVSGRNRKKVAIDQYEGKTKECKDDNGKADITDAMQLFDLKDAKKLSNGSEGNISLGGIIAHSVVEAYTGEKLRQNGEYIKSDEDWENRYEKAHSAGQDAQYEVDNKELVSERVMPNESVRIELKDKTTGKLSKINYSYKNRNIDKVKVGNGN